MKTTSLGGDKLGVIGWNRNNFNPQNFTGKGAGGPLWYAYGRYPLHCTKVHRNAPSISLSELTIIGLSRWMTWEVPKRVLDDFGLPAPRPSYMLGGSNYQIPFTVYQSTVSENLTHLIQQLRSLWVAKIGRFKGVVRHFHPSILYFPTDSDRCW